MSDADKNAVAEDESLSDKVPDEKERMDDTADEPSVEPQLGGEKEGAEEEPGETSEEEETTENQQKKDEPPGKPKKKQNLIKSVMEYDLADMYPEMSTLTDRKKREWDYQNPDTIRALWLESKTNVLAEWKVRYLAIKKARKPQIEVRDTTTQALRTEYRKNKEEDRKNAEQKELGMIEKGRESPKFDEVKLPTNITTDLRYKFTRNNPPVPHYYLKHFEKHKKPPFKLHGISLAGCKPL